MNYRHHYHAGNFADVWKHTLLLALVRGLQRKGKGILYLDTHAGRGAYDLRAAAKGDSLERVPEWPHGIGRVVNRSADRPPDAVADYLAIVRAFAARRTEAERLTADDWRPQWYPGSPWIVQACLRPQDRMALYESQQDEHHILQREFRAVPRVRVEQGDGYRAIRSCLPPPERRALVLIDPPFEAQDEFLQVAAALAEGSRRLPAGTFAVWYPLTERARSDAFIAQLETMKLPPCWIAELRIVGDDAVQKLKGCSLLVVNPPWQLDELLAPSLSWLTKTLAQSPAADSALRWLVPE